MKTLYFECNMGAAGDMIMAALLELHDNPAEFLDRLNDVGIPGVVVNAGPSVKHGISGTKVTVSIDDQVENPYMHGLENGDEYSHGSHFYDIEHLMGHLGVCNEVRENALGIYRLIADAKSHVRGVPVNQIQLNEAGEMDAVADIVGACMLMSQLAPDLVMASPVHVGSGQVRCSHGVVPVPAPATAHILRDIPMYGGCITGELCTPTGAAILRYFASDFGPMPIMKVAKIGYGIGTEDFEYANCLRAFIGETAGAAEAV